MATALVNRPKGSVRTFGISIWLLFQTKMGEKHNQFLTKNNNAIFRFGKQDFRLMTYKAVDRIYTEDVGNGLGGGHGYKLHWKNRDDMAARWFNIVISADAQANTFKMFVNGKVVEYAHKDSKETHFPWPIGGGFQINYEKNTDQDGLVMGRWLGGYATSGYTSGVAGFILAKDMVFDQKRAQYLYELGKRGIPFDGIWHEKVPELKEIKK
ncbi:MAG: hypothetical protein COA79_04070 [Planctomycetota bacterium]|nr:MAG: hypothetical protein COA79_04070 [Planctomycetota bacterium]